MSSVNLYTLILHLTSNYGVTICPLAGTRASATIKLTFFLVLDRVLVHIPRYGVSQILQEVLINLPARSVVTPESPVLDPTFTEIKR